MLLLNDANLWGLNEICTFFSHFLLFRRVLDQNYSDIFNKIA